MTHVVVCTGQTTKKLLYGGTGEVEVTPFVGQDSMRHFGVGIGILYPDGRADGCIWGLIMPQFLIQSWRAMKMLEKTSQVYAGYGLASFWYLGRERLHTSDLHYLEEASRLFENYEQFREVRAQALASFPTEEELEKMLAVVEVQKLDISKNEIEEQRRNLEPASQILERLRAADKVREDKVRDENSRRAAPTPPPPPKRKGFFARLFSN